jgi:hypothetical protein
MDKHNSLLEQLLHEEEYYNAPGFESQDLQFEIDKQLQMVQMQLPESNRAEVAEPTLHTSELLSYLKITQP